MKTKTKIIITSLLIIALFASFFLVNNSFFLKPTEDIKGLEKVSAYENGVLYQTNGSGGQGKFYVVNVQGTFREMGRQYGYLLKDQLSEFYNAATQRLLTHNVTQDYVNQVAEYLYQIEPDFAKDFITGMSETSGMSFEKQKAESALFGTLFGCSSMSAWGNYTTDGLTVVGRNWDTVRGLFDDYGKYLVVTVYHPVGYTSSVAEVNYVGTLALQSGMNNHGVFLDLQNGAESDPAVYGNRTPGSCTLYSFLFNSTTLDQVDALFRTTQPNMGLIINAADANRASVYEWATYDVKSRTSPDGLVASSNHFIDPSWTNLPTIPDGLDGGFTKERQSNLMARGEQYKGTINAAKMMEIFDVTIPNGGATFPNDSVFETYYQIVAVPKDLNMWLNALGYSGWENIDLKPLFQTP